ncbi:hypothetical protein RF11_09497 [Thelohanellus kitauei]|uniref:Transglutaminase N-terminal domain-containing protein n=1 Tax=Thelohanellus kitauei TaxID=669202 RepID=A0A0C2N2X0_THEKT|nr:hypothetical protein RF11_09497 [Thelohanellus kitauei]
MNVSDLSKLKKWILLRGNNFEPITKIKTRNENIEIIYDQTIHNTSKYDPNVVVVRRGTNFYIHHTKLDGIPIHQKDIVLILQTLDRNVMTEIKLTPDSRKDRGFEMNVEKINEKSILVKITVHIDCGIGLYSLFWVNMHEKFTFRNSVYVIFNPFQHDDDVFNPDPLIISQHLIGEGIKIYTGSLNCHKPINYLLDQVKVKF